MTSIFRINAGLLFLVMVLVGCSDADHDVPTADDTTMTNNDADGDGVSNDVDQCPDTDAGAAVDGNGCADNQLDSDGDGVTNDQDQCPATASGNAVDATGCASTTADSDMDGVADALDVCPDSVLVDSEGNDFEFFASGCPKLTSARDGISYDVFLVSDVDQERIAFTIHEPRSVDSAQTYPMMATSHGYGGSRTDDRPGVGGSLESQLLDNAYGFYSMDQRGHGESGGQIRLLDPDFEGLDQLKILDFIAENVSWLDFSEGSDDYLLGSFGLSYGGGFQHNLLRLDPKQRLDAMAPDITWNDLRYSIATNGVFKTKWAALLSALGNATPGGHHPDVNAGLARGVATGDVNGEERLLLYRSSLAYNCDGDNVGDFISQQNGTQIDVGGPITPIPSLYTQATSDTLFDLTDAYRNYQCLRDLDAAVDVRLHTHLGGHDGGGNKNCGDGADALVHADTRLAFFNFHIKGDSTALDNIPSICLNVPDVSGAGNNAIQRTAAQGFPVGTDGNPDNRFDASYVDPISGMPVPYELSQANAQIVNVPVYTAQQDNEVLAGIPTIELTLSRTPGGDAIPFDGILFVGIAISTNDGLTYQLPNQTNRGGTGQTLPLRDRQVSADVAEQLVGIEALLNAGDIVAVQYRTSDPTYQNSGSRTSGVIATIEAMVNLPLLGVRGIDNNDLP